DPAGRVETGDLKAYVFRRGADTVTAAWCPARPGETRELELKLDPRSVHAQNLMGNLRGIRSGRGTASVALSNEPVYLRFAGIAPGEVLKALREASLLSPEP